MAKDDKVYVMSILPLYHFTILKAPKKNPSEIYIKLQIVVSDLTTGCYEK